MRKPLSAVCLSLLVFAACTEQQPAAAPLAAPPPAETAPVAVSPQPMAEPAKEAPKPIELTPEQNAKVYQECWTAFNAKDWTKFSGCFADNATSEGVDMGMPPLVGKDIVEKGSKSFAASFPDATGEAQLTLVNGNNVVGVWLMRGTHKGPLPSPSGDIAPTNKKIGYLIGHVAELKGGKAAHEQLYADAHTMLGQLGLAPGPVRKVQDHGAADKPVVLATNSDAEKANVETYKKYTEAFNKHDAAASEAVLTDDFVFSDQTMPADLVGKKEAMKSMKELWKGMSDAKVTLTSAWGAGDYVVSTASLSGTNDGPIPSMKLWKKTGKTVNVKVLSVAKLTGGKLKQEWLFANGLAFADQLGLLPPLKTDKKPIAAAAPAKPAGASTPGAAPTAPKAAAPATPATPAAPKAAAPGTPTPAAPKAAAPGTPTPAAPKAVAPAAPAAAPKAAVPAPAPAPAK